MTVVRSIISRLPHIENYRDHWHKGARVFRVYGGKPYRRFCALDYTRARFYSGQPAWVRLRVFGFTVYERNHHLSGLPGARS